MMLVRTDQSGEKEHMEGYQTENAVRATDQHVNGSESKDSK